jgi:DNA mismatch repair ATPase MutS
MAVALDTRSADPERARPVDPERWVVGVALLDLSTGEFTAAEYRGAEAGGAFVEDIVVLKPREIIIPSGTFLTMEGLSVLVTHVDAWLFETEAARRALLDQLRAGGLEGFGLDAHPAAVSAAGALVQHLRAQKLDLAHVRAIKYRERRDTLLIDPTTLNAQAPRDCRRLRGGPHRLAARRARSNGHFHWQPASPVVAPRAAGRARADSRSA